MIKHNIPITWYEMLLCILLYHMLNSLCFGRFHQSLIYSLKRQSLNDVTAIGAILPRPQQIAFSLFNLIDRPLFLCVYALHRIMELYNQWKVAHWGRDKMAAVLQTTISNAFSLIEISDFLLHIHINMFLGVQLMIIIINSGSGLTPNRRQPITWINKRHTTSVY